MIVSASRRTDIPAFYAPWFYNRLKEGYVLVPNPFNPRTVSRVGLTPDTVDCIVFWTKNPAPMLDGLERLRDYRYYFQFTLNPYGRDMERNLPALEARLGTFRRLAERIGPERVIWRYDPVLLGGAYDIRFHTGAFAALAAGLKGYTERCMIGFLDFYRHIRKVMDEAGAGAPSPEDTERLAAAFGDTAAKYGILLETCTSKVDLRRFGIRSGCCIERWRPARRMQLCGEYRYRDVRKLPARLHVLLRCKGRCGSGGEEVRHARYSLSHDAGISAAGGYHSRTYRRESAENTGKVVLNAAAAGLIQTVRRRLVAICG